MAHPVRHQSLGSAAAILLMLINFDPVFTQTSCPSGFTYLSDVNGCYQVIQTKQTWTNAAKACAALAPGAHLAFIDSIQEDQAVNALVKPSGVQSACTNNYLSLGTEFWLGAQRYDPSYRSDFYWKATDGTASLSPLEYSSWYSSEPNYSSSSESCLAIVSSYQYKWNDAPCAQTFCSVCEVDVSVQTTQYCIRVYTSNIANGGTTSGVFIKLRGNSTSSEYKLFASGFDSFAQGLVAKFCTTTIPSVGTLTGITIRQDNTGSSSPNWFLDKVVVQDSSRTYTFLAYRWLDASTALLDGAVQVDLTPSVLENLAYMKPTWQSSTSGLYASSRAVDGIKNRYPGPEISCSCSYTLSELNAWWAVDLGKPAFVDGVQITTRSDGGAEVNNKFIVGLSNTPPRQLTPVSVPANYYICNSGPQIIRLAEYVYFMCQQPAGQPSTRYVIVQLNQTTNYLFLCEVEVFGTIDTSACNSNPCRNGGTCLSNGANSYTCSCLPGYSGPTCAAPVCPDGFTYISGVNGCYRLLIGNQPWSTAAATCASYASGAHLAFVNSDLEQNAIANFIVTYTNMEFSQAGTCNAGQWWLGAQRTDPATNTPFQWKTSGSSAVGSVVYQNWYTNPPSFTTTGLESCAVVSAVHPYKWYASACETQTYCGVCEFDMPNNPIVNLALKQPATMYTLSTTSLASRGTDGDSTSNSTINSGCFTTASVANAWWAVDLGRPAFVQGVELVPRSDSSIDYSHNVYIGVTNIAPTMATPPQFSNYDLCARGPLYASLGKVYLVQCAQNLPASRYVVVQIETSNYLSFCEVEVYGTYVTGTCATMPCKNGGTCTNIGSAYTCACAVGWTGTTCSTAATNLALLKKAVQSTTSGTSYGAALAVDGNANASPSSCSITNGDINTWWAVDLAAPTFVQGVTLVNRFDSSPERNNNFIVGLTNMNPSSTGGRVPHPTSYTVGICGRGPPYTLGQSYIVRCAPNLASARYVVIQSEVSNYLQICELYVYGQQDSGPCSRSPCANGGLCQNAGSSFTCTCAVGWTGTDCSTAAVNLALNNPTWQSSTAGSTYIPSYGNDGKRDTAIAKCALTNAENSAWWAVDLGAPAYVQGVVLVNRGDGNGYYDSKFIVGLTNTPPTQNLPDQNNYVTCGYGPTQADVSGVYYITCAANQAAARYVVVQLPATNAYNLAVCELEVYGNPDTSACNSNPCRNGGTCIPTSGGFTCQCFVGWTDSTCSTAAVNIALGQTAVQSTTYSIWQASRAVDGNRATLGGEAGSCSATLAEAHPWWSVDLVQPTYVQGVLFVMYQSSYGAAYRVAIGLSNISPLVRAPNPGGYAICGNSIANQPASAQIYILCAANQAPARYVIAQFESGSDNLRICEFEVYSGQGPCASSPCKNGGACTNAGADFTCSCTEGLSGKDCSIQTNPCKPSPCANGGNCTSIGSTVTCTCASGWTGINCEIIADPCVQSPCSNGGICIASGTTRACNCLPGWGGSDCTTDLNVCLKENPCENDGVCNKVGDGYSCTCPQGFAGTNCELDQTACSQLSDSSRINCGWGGVTTAQCNSKSCCYDPTASARHQASCFYTKDRCMDITEAQRVDCYQTSSSNALYCYERGCCWDATVQEDGLRCYRRAARDECIGVPAENRIARQNPGGTPNLCESRGACWDSSIRDKPSLWCFDVAS